MLTSLLSDSPLADLAPNPRHTPTRWPRLRLLCTRSILLMVSLCETDHRTAALDSPVWLPANSFELRGNVVKGLERIYAFLAHLLSNWSPAPDATTYLRCYRTETLFNLTLVVVCFGAPTCWISHWAETVETGVVEESGISFLDGFVALIILLVLV